MEGNLATVIYLIEVLDGLHHLKDPCLLGLLIRLGMLKTHGILGLVRHNCIGNVSRDTVIALQVLH